MDNTQFFSCMETRNLSLELLVEILVDMLVEMLVVKSSLNRIAASLGGFPLFLISMETENVAS